MKSEKHARELAVIKLSSKSGIKKGSISIKEVKSIKKYSSVKQIL